MKIVLCDDDIRFIKQFECSLREEFRKRSVAAEIVSASSGAHALRELTAAPTDVLFLDIDMPVMNGFSVAEELAHMENKPLIIFLSSMEHLVYRSFAFQPFWFLRKSHMEDLADAIDKLLQVLSDRQEYYTVVTSGSNIRIQVSDIVYFDSEGHYITVHTTSREIRFRARMADVEHELAQCAFVRCHIGYLVNCRFIQICTKNELVLTTGQRIPVSRAKAEETQSMFMSYMRSLRP